MPDLRHNKEREDDFVLQKERHAQIIAKLNLEGQVRVKNLSQDFCVTEDCIRKDLTYLEKQGRLKRVHGGATQIRKNPHTPHVVERMSVCSEEKKEIAKKAIELIEPGTTVFLGISTICLEIAKLIYQKDLRITLVTNMVDIMKMFMNETNTELIFIGGSFNQAKDGFSGPLAIEQIKNFKFDLSFLGVVGIDAYDGKVTTYEAMDGLTKKEVLNSSKQVYMVAESAKLNQDGNYVFANVADFTGMISESAMEIHKKEKLLRFEIDIL